MGSAGCCGSTEEGQLTPCHKIWRAFLEEAASQLRLKSELQLQHEELWGERGRCREGWAKAAWEGAERLMDPQVTVCRGASGSGWGEERWRVPFCWAAGRLGSVGEMILALRFRDAHVFS